MNAPLSAPALHRPRPRVGVIGAGPGGLAAAMLLAARGCNVTVFEKDATVGGRSRTLTTPDGFQFDLGPTFFLYPRILMEIFASCGYRLEDEIELIKLDPLYRLKFEDGDVTVDATSDTVQMQAEIAKLCPADAAGLPAFLAENRRKLAKFRPILENPFASPTRFLAPDLLKALSLMRPHKTVDSDLHRYFHDPRVRLAFSFQTKYLGMSPFRCPSLFTILSFLEYEHGVFHPRGGCGAVSTAMARVAEELGVDIRLETPVEQIAFEGRRAVGIDADGRRHATDAVVVNADFAHAVPRLIPDTVRKRWSNAKIEGSRYSCSTFMLYLGIEGALPDVAHHNVVLSKRYMENIDAIERGIMPDDPSYYLQHATATDATMAPAGQSTLYMLVPVPNLRSGIDWQQEAPRFRRVALDRMKSLGITDIEPRIRYERVVTPQDWRDDFSVGYGATFNLSHDLRQMLCFRPGNRFADAEGVYLVGGGTHPGSGLPVIYEGARISANLLLQDLGLDALAGASAA